MDPSRLHGKGCRSSCKGCTQKRRPERIASEFLEAMMNGCHLQLFLKIWKHSYYHKTCTLWLKNLYLKLTIEFTWTTIVRFRSPGHHSTSNSKAHYFKTKASSVRPMAKKLMHFPIDRLIDRKALIRPLDNGECGKPGFHCVKTFIWKSPKKESPIGQYTHQSWWCTIVYLYHIKNVSAYI